MHGPKRSGQCLASDIDLQLRRFDLCLLAWRYHAADQSLFGLIDGDRYRVALANGVLTYRPATDADTAARNATLTADRATFMQATLAPHTFAALTQSGKLQVDGDDASWTRADQRASGAEPAQRGNSKRTRLGDGRCSYAARA